MQLEMVQSESKLRLIQKILRKKILEYMKMDDVKHKKNRTEQSNKLHCFPA